MKNGPEINCSNFTGALIKKIVPNILWKGGKDGAELNINEVCQIWKTDSKTLFFFYTIALLG